MGEQNSKPKTNTQYLKEYLNAVQKKKKLEFGNDNFQQLDAQEFKQNCLTLLKAYSERTPLREYQNNLKKCIIDYENSKFIPFFANLTFLLSDEKLVEGRGLDPEIKSKKNISLPSVKEIETIKPMIRAHSEVGDYKVLEKGTYGEKVMNFLDIELMRRDNFFYQMSEKFGKLFFDKFHIPEDQDATIANLEEAGIFVESTSTEKETDAYQASLKVVKSFKNFLMSCLKNFVEMISQNAFNDNSLVPNEKNLCKMACKVLFARGDCYNMVMELIQKKHIDNIEKLETTLNFFSNYNLEQFQIREDLCLKQEREPYQHVIDTINYLNVFQNPYDKINLILRIRKEIANCIDEYNQKCNHLENNKKLTINADDISSLYRFCIIKSKNVQMKAHQVFIEEFIDDNSIKFGDEGYYFSTFSACLELLIAVSENPLSLISFSSSESNQTSNFRQPLEVLKNNCKLYQFNLLI